MEIFKKCFKNVLSYAAGSQQMFQNLMTEFGYQTISTFFGDLSIAEWYGTAGVKDTYNEVLKAWSGNTRMFTEFVMALNHKCWFWYQTKQFIYDECDNKSLSGLYSDLYYQACDYVRDNWDDEAQDYFYQTTD